MQRSFRVVTAGAAIGAAVWPLAALTVHGLSAFDAAPYLPWTQSEFPRHPVALVIPCLFALPFILLALSHARAGRTLRCSRWLLWSVFVFALLKVMPVGVLSPGWFLQPMLVVITAVAFGALPGLAMAATAALGLALCAHFQAPSAAFSPSGYALPVVGILLGGGLLGALLHRTMQGLFAVETEQRERIEQTLRALRQRERLLRHAMRVATIGEMAGMVVHQLRNKFQLIQGHVALGLLADAREKDRRLHEIEGAVQAASGVVEQLLTLAHPGENAQRLVDLAEECRTFADRVRPLLPPSIRLETLFAAGALPVSLVPEELGDALLNLVLNAKQAMRHGTIRIEACAGGEGTAVVTVSDDCPGIAEQVRTRLFTPFVTTKGRGNGTGLGLVAVDRFVRTSGGHIDVDTEPGRGTAFHLVFPCVPIERQVRVG